MLLFDNKIVGLPIASVQSSHRVATTTDYIIDPRNLSITAFYVDSRLGDGQLVLYTSDIKDFSGRGILIDNNDRLMETEGLIRLQKLIDINFKAIGKLVVTEDNVKLGKVSSFVFDSQTWLILKLHVRRSIVKSVNTSELIIHRQQIVKISDSKITVKSTSIKDAKQSFSWKKLIVGNSKPALESETTTGKTKG